MSKLSAYAASINRSNAGEQKPCHHAASGHVGPAPVSAWHPAGVSTTGADGSAPRGTGSEQQDQPSGASARHWLWAWGSRPGCVRPRSQSPPAEVASTLPTSLHPPRQARRGGGGRGSLNATADPKQRQLDRLAPPTCYPRHDRRRPTIHFVVSCSKHGRGRSACAGHDDRWQPCGFRAVIARRGLNRRVRPPADLPSSNVSAGYRPARRGASRSATPASN